MKKYCFIKDEETGLVQLGVGCSDEYYIEIGMVERDVEQSKKNGLWYLTEKCPHYTEEEKLQIAKEDKILLNDELRDKALFGGVEYQGVLFDSDTDQKINLSETVRDMSDTDTITWFGMDNTALLCTKADLLAIGEEIRNLTKFCWGMNAHIKEQIANAETIEQVEAIEISYDRTDT
jgi:hypothetical protein